MGSLRLPLIALAVVPMVAGMRDASPPGPAVVWRIDSVARIGGHAATVSGSPRVVATAAGKAVEFNGRTDGLFLDVNPLAGLERFTVEVIFEPAPGGPEEQRFVHFEEAGAPNRALVELRMLPGGTWCLDTFLRHGDASLTLIDRAAAHPAARVHAAALTFDGATMIQYVDRVREASGAVRFKPLGAGRTSIGVRQNRVSWFKGRIYLIRVTPGALTPAELLRAGTP